MLMSTHHNPIRSRLTRLTKHLAPLAVPILTGGIIHAAFSSSSAESSGSNFSAYANSNPGYTSATYSGPYEYNMVKKACGIRSADFTTEHSHITVNDNYAFSGSTWGSAVYISAFTSVANSSGSAVGSVF